MLSLVFSGDCLMPPRSSKPEGKTRARAGRRASRRRALFSQIRDWYIAVYVGVGVAIDGKVNPVLTAAEGQVVQLTLSEPGS
jgi:nitrite reductase (NO-forming)